MIELQSVSKTFRRGHEAVPAVSGVDLRIEDREVVAIIGPSGCGKSTLLNMIAGLYAPSAGRVLYDGADVTDINTAVGYMTQKDNLLPWRTIRDNVALPLELAGIGRGEREREAGRVLAELGLAGFETRYSSELSGGMRKRACLARMLLCSPRTLLLDEPFAALDAQLKLAMYEMLLRLSTANRQTVLLVTHDLVEAVTLADRVVVFTHRPSRIALEQAIDLPRPRDVLNIRFTDRFRELYSVIWERLRREYVDEKL